LRTGQYRPSGGKRSALDAATFNLIVQLFLGKTERRIGFKIRIPRKGLRDAIVILLKNSRKRAKKPGCEERAFCFGKIESEFLYFNICRHFPIIQRSERFDKTTIAGGPRRIELSTLNSVKERGSNGALRSQPSTASATQPLPQSACRARPPGIWCRQASRATVSVNKITAPCNMKPVSLLALDDEFVGLKNVQWFGLREGGSAFNYRQSTSGFPNLLVHDLDLLVDHLAGETVDRHVDPVMLFPYNYKAILETCSIRRVAP